MLEKEDQTILAEMQGRPGAVEEDTIDRGLLDEIRNRFLHVESDPHIGDRVYLENAGGSLTLKAVVETLANTSPLPSNAGRDNDGSRAIDELIARGRLAVREFLQADDGVIIAGETTTANAFRVFGAATHNAEGGKNLICTDLDHAAFFDASAYFAKLHGLERRVASFDPKTGTLPPDAVVDLVDEDTIAVSVIHASNITGGKNDLRTIVEGVRQKSPDAIVIADGAQHVQHGCADVSDLDVDAYLFSDYKAFTCPGYGFAYLSPRVSTLPHVKLAGKAEDEWDLGTRNYLAFACFEQVVEYLKWLGHRVGNEEQSSENKNLVKAAYQFIEHYEQQLGTRLLEGSDNVRGLLEYDEVELLGEQGVSDQREAVFAFRIRGMEAKDVVAQFVSKGIIIHDRCCNAYSRQTMERLGVDAIARVSLAHYTSPEEVDRFLIALSEVVRRI